ncbi:MAG: FHA domain-containing protein [Anaerolineales bacterium]|nr:FHA domain-containing protein [Anaerolineales bacterium]
MSGPAFLVLRVLLTVSLYVFLGWAFFMLWQDIHQQGTLLSLRKVPPLSLLIQREAMPPQIRHFTQAEITIGRDPTCECPIKDDTVSARHARLNYHHGQWWLEDLGSTNGTDLNSERMTTPTVVISHDEIACGKATLTVMLAGDVLLPPTQKMPKLEKKK